MSDRQLTETELSAIVARLVDRIRREMQLEAVPPADVIRGTWEDGHGWKALMGSGADRIGTSGTVPQGANELAAAIDHTMLKPTATRSQIVEVCHEALQHNFASVCVNTTWIKLAAGLLANSRVKPIAVVGFPLGAMVTAAKAAETRQAIADGAEEIDMVINIGALKGRDHDLVYDDIAAVVQASAGRPVKVILETTMLEREEKISGCAIAKAAGAAFVKTSTGFGGGGATLEDVALMRAVVGPDMGVKASGGVRNADDARKMIEAGATRLGASASVAIVTGGAGSGGY